MSPTMIGHMDDDDDNDQRRSNMPNLPEDSPFRDFFKQFPQFKNGMPNSQQTAARRHGARARASSSRLTAMP